MTNLNYTLKPTHISLIKPDDIVMLDGKLRTVCPANIKRGGLLGVTLWGDSYRGGTLPVPKAVLAKPVNPSV